MYAKMLMKDIPIAYPRLDFSGYDGFIIGTPTRFSNMVSQMRNLWDQISNAWLMGTIIGKPASVFTSTIAQHRGQETIIISILLTLLHQGFVYVGLTYKFQEQNRIDEITRGSPYGVSTISGSRFGDRMSFENEL